MLRLVSDTIKQDYLCLCLSLAFLTIGSWASFHFISRWYLVKRDTTENLCDFNIVFSLDAKMIPTTIPFVPGGGIIPSLPHVLSSLPRCVKAYDLYHLQR